MNYWVRVIQVDGMTLEEIKSGCGINYGELTHGVVADNGHFVPDVVWGKGRNGIKLTKKLIDKCIEDCLEEKENG